MNIMCLYASTCIYKIKKKRPCFTYKVNKPKNNNFKLVDRNTRGGIRTVDYTDETIFGLN